MNMNNEIAPSLAPILTQGGDIPDRMSADNNASNGVAGDLKKISGDLQGSSKLSLSFLKPSSNAEEPRVAKKCIGEVSTEKQDKQNPSESKSPETKKRRTRKKWKKPKDKPSRPLSAYNLFFQAERAAMLGDDATLVELERNKKRVHRKTHGKIGFAEMARHIGQKWKELSEETKKPYYERATKEKECYIRDLAAWKEEQYAKHQPQKSLVVARKVEKLESDSEGASSVEVLPSSKERTDDDLKLKVMANEMKQKNLVAMQNRSEAEYLQFVQERALLARRSLLDSTFFQYGPGASEASATALLQLQNGRTGVGAGLRAGPLAGMGPMGMNFNRNALGLNMNSMGMNMNAMGMNMNAMGMNMNAMGMNMNAMGMNAMGMNAFGSTNMMTATELQQRQAQLSAANRLQQLRASATLGTNMGDHAFVGSRNNAVPTVIGNGQGDLGRSRYPESNMTAEMARRLQDRFNL